MDEYAQYRHVEDVEHPLQLIFSRAWPVFGDRCDVATQYWLVYLTSTCLEPTVVPLEGNIGSESDVVAPAGVVIMKTRKVCPGEGVIDCLKAFSGNRTVQSGIKIRRHRWRPAQHHLPVQLILCSEVIACKAKLNPS